jgi:hypothetical protein
MIVGVKTAIRAFTGVGGIDKSGTRYLIEREITAESKRILPIKPIRSIIQPVREDSFPMLPRFGDRKKRDRDKIRRHARGHKTKRFTITFS